jgi:hypothetical protein
MDDMGTWTKLLGKSQDDTALKAALAAAGVKKIPKLGRDEFRVFADLKGHGMSIEMTDEAVLKDLTDQDRGEGPLILTGVDAFIERKKNRDVYKGKLPYNLAPDMTRADVRKVLGSPKVSDDQVPYDLWLRDKFEVTVGYTKDLKVGHVNVEVAKSR